MHHSYCMPCMMCTGDMCRLGVYIWGEGKKFYVLTKRVKKIHYCLVWGFSNDLSNQGGVNGLGIYSDSSVDLLS